MNMENYIKAMSLIATQYNEIPLSKLEQLIDIGYKVKVTPFPQGSESFYIDNTADVEMHWEDNDISLEHEQCYMPHLNLALLGEADFPLGFFDHHYQSAKESYARQGEDLGYGDYLISSFAMSV